MRRPAQHALKGPTPARLVRMLCSMSEAPCHVYVQMCTSRSIRRIAPGNLLESCSRQRIKIKSIRDKHHQHIAHHALHWRSPALAIIVLHGSVHPHTRVAHHDCTPVEYPNSGLYELPDGLHTSSDSNILWTNLRCHDLYMLRQVPPIVPRALQGPTPTRLVGDDTSTARLICSSLD